MPIQIQKDSLSPLAEQGRTIYEEQLKAILEPAHNGEAVAIHVDSGDYVIGNNHRDAAHALANRHEADGRIVTLTIGLPTDADLRLATRFAAGRVFRDHLARVPLTLPGAAGTITVEFILDTGFEGDLALPSNLLRQLDARPLFLSLRALGDGTLVECPVYQIELEWNEMPRTVDILALEHNPLLGTMLLEGCRLEVEMMENGEVVIELPD